MGDTSPIKNGFESQIIKLGMSSVSNWLFLGITEEGNENLYCKNKPICHSIFTSPYPSYNVLLVLSDSPMLGQAPFVFYTLSYIHHNHQIYKVL